MSVPHQDTKSVEGDCEVHELDRSGNVQRRWLQSASGGLTLVCRDELAQKSFTFKGLILTRRPQILVDGQSAGIFFGSLRDWRKAFFDAFLPVGYPHSVSHDYLAYQRYDSLQAFFSTITSLLANRALLEGLGVGDAESSATYAMLLTIMKDAMSRVATIVFAHRFGLRIEPDAKRFRFLADLFNDTAFFLELYSPYLGQWGKIAALGTGEALRALCGVAAGASKAALSVHFAKHDNLAELNAKEASQETAVGLVGLLVGTLVVRYVQDHSIVVYLMTALVFAHLWMNYLGVRSVCMTTFNRQRATILYETYLQTDKVMTPAEVAAKESILFWNPIVRNVDGLPVATITFPTSWPEAMRGCNDSRSFTDINMREPKVKLRVYRGGVGLCDIRVLHSPGATAQDVVASWFAAMDAARKIRADKSMTDFAAEVVPWAAIKAAGWKLDMQGLETGAPLRVKMMPATKKEQ